MKLQFCMQCAAPLHPVSPTKYVCDAGHEYFNNPKAAVTIIFYKDGQALFAERAVEPAKGLFDFPGGFVDYGESASDAAYREIAEETEVIPQALQLVGSTANQYDENISTCDFIFLCTEWSGEFVAADDVMSLQWKPLEFMQSSSFAWTYEGVYDTVLLRIR